MHGFLFSFSVERVFAFFAIVFWGLAAIGAIQAYSPVPYWDMWNGFVGFFLAFSSGDWSAWWAQHNEHRILLARLLFWIDLTLFDGYGWFLLAANYAFLGIICLVFWFSYKEISNNNNIFLGIFPVIWMSSWAQADNLTWGFQTQFFWLSYSHYQLFTFFIGR